MALPDDAARVKEALRAIPGIRSVTGGWPRADAVLPCVAVELAALVPAEHADNRRYAVSLTYDLRLFAPDIDQREALSSDIDDVMLALGYALELVYHENSQGRMSVMRYGRIIGGCT